MSPPAPVREILYLIAGLYGSIGIGVAVSWAWIKLEKRAGAKKQAEKPHELVLVRYDEANRMLLRNVGWRLAPEEDTNTRMGWVYLERDLATTDVGRPVQLVAGCSALPVPVGATGKVISEGLTGSMVQVEFDPDEQTGFIGGRFWVPRESIIKRWVADEEFDDPPDWVYIK